MKRVIFACVENAGRSQMAAAFFNSLANPALAKATSAGTEPAFKVNPEVSDSMWEVGISLGGAKPQKLTDEMATGAELLVTMGCGEQCPAVPGLRHDDWPLEDPKDATPEKVREIRDDVRKRVEALLAKEGWGR